MEQTGPRVHVAPVRCPFCHEAVPRGEAPAICAECHALHHAACMSEHGACAACGKRTSSPDDSKLAALPERSKLAAAPRAWAVPRQMAPKAELRPRSEPKPGDVLLGFAFGAVVGCGLFFAMGYPLLPVLALAAPFGLVGLLIGQLIPPLLELIRLYFHR